MCTCLSTYPSTNASDYLHFWAIVNNAVMNMNVQIPLWAPAVNSFGHIYLEVEFLGHVIILYLIFWGTAIAFSTAGALFLHFCQPCLSLPILVLFCLPYHSQTMDINWYLTVVLIWIYVLTLKSDWFCDWLWSMKCQHSNSGTSSIYNKFDSSPLPVTREECA